jgi:hypothetical protein
MQHHPGSVSGVPNPSEGPPTEEGFCPLARTRKVEEDNRNSGADTTPSASSCASSPSSESADDTKESPQFNSDFLDHPEGCIVTHVFEQLPPRFTGYHTTDVNGVKEQYKGADLLRCDPGPGGKCLGDQMKHRHGAHFENLDRRAKYNQNGDHDRRHWHLWPREESGYLDYSLEELL